MRVKTSSGRLRAELAKRGETGPEAANAYAHIPHTTPHNSQCIYVKTNEKWRMQNVKMSTMRGHLYRSATFRQANAEKTRASETSFARRNRASRDSGGNFFSK